MRGVVKTRIWPRYDGSVIDSVSEEAKVREGKTERKKKQGKMAKYQHQYFIFHILRPCFLELLQFAVINEKKQEEINSTHS